MNFFQRLFKMGEAEAHAAIDKLENPIRLTEQGIRDLKNDLDKSLQALAEVKAMSIRSKNEASSYKNKAADYEKKAMLVLKRAQEGKIEPAEADRLASEALLKKEEAAKQGTTAEANSKNFEQNISQIDANVKKLKSNISHYENELKTLKARAKVSATTKKLNKQMSQIDSGGTISTLERMKEKVEQDEALAQAYGDISNENKSLDDEIDSVLSDDKSIEASDALAELKAKMKI
ncbi:MAG: PspA/IM30 family protein [Bacteroidetes bacterium]|jgi:phage shock protein A|nr:PspA/IM30 family protein [Bacteroidota bacterium]MBT6687886.1 PspA/IM30 family protein [Bacteroidota bacterium]MBT7142466.1 PspA/IM30 family protein [Bacteroidota bacterium]MBT7490027.1 PspA/IM30 family protein [Bacteroidota bacterium]